MSVHEVRVRSEGKYHLELALTLILEDHYGPSHHKKPGAVSHWKVVDNVLVFGWHRDMMDSVSLPAPMGKEALAGLIMGWLETATYPREPDHDGSNSRGYEISTVGYEDFYAMFKVAPYWMEYGK